MAESLPQNEHPLNLKARELLLKTQAPLTPEKPYLVQLVVAALGDVRMSGRQFHDVLESALAEFTLGLVPATLDQVLVGSIERSRHPAVRAAFA